MYRQIGEAVPPLFSAGIATDMLIELLSVEPTKQQLKESPQSIEKPVSSSYSSVIAGISQGGVEAEGAGCGLLQRPVQHPVGYHQEGLSIHL